MRKKQSDRFIPRLTELEDRRTPATFTVTTTDDLVDAADGKTSLREAITAANLTPEADKIKLKAGRYSIGLAGQGEDGNATGDFDISSPVAITGVSADKTIVTARAFDRVFDVFGDGESAFAVSFAKMTIRDGGVIEGGDFNTPGGGGIRASLVGLVLTDAVVTNNRVGANGGGGILNNSFGSFGALTLTRTTVSRNVSNVDGGGVMYPGRAVTIVDSTVSRNHAGGRGGGVHAGTLTVTDSLVANNTSGGEAAGLYAANTIGLVGSALRNNSAGFDQFGGGLVTTNVTVTDSVVSGNYAGKGGGIAATLVEVTDSRVVNNYARNQGGGIYSISDLRVTDSAISGNRSDADGGGVFNVGGTTTMVGGEVNGNSSGATGGGIALANLDATGTTFDGNTSVNFGGGISALTAKLRGVTVSNNFADTFGGGINAVNLDLVNVTVSGNAARTQSGGGIYGHTGTIKNSTIVENYARQGGAGLQWSGVNTPIQVQNTIVAMNLTTSQFATDVSGTFTSLGNNFIGVGGASFTAAGDRNGTQLEPIDPMLTILRNNGGKTLTHAPKPGSPVIDAGNSSAAPDKDARGKTRVKGADIDIGAVEK